MTDYGQLEHEVDAVEGLIWDVASHVWEYAELGYKEYKSSSYVCEALEKQGFAISERGIGGLETSWVATSGNGGPSLAFSSSLMLCPTLATTLCRAERQPKAVIPTVMAAAIT